MLQVEVGKGGIDAALKKLKRKVDKTKMIRDEIDKAHEKGCLIVTAVLGLGFTMGVIIVYLLLK